MAKTPKMGISDFENLTEMSLVIRNLLWWDKFVSMRFTQWNPDEWFDEGNYVGRDENCERMCCTAASSLPLENSESVNENLDTGTCRQSQ